MVNFLCSDSVFYSDLKSKYNNSRRQNRCKYLKNGKDNSNGNGNGNRNGSLMVTETVT